MVSRRNRRASVVFVLITMFIDVLGMGVVIPIPPKLVQSLLGGAIAEASFVFGLLVSIYAVMQFFAQQGLQSVWVPDTTYRYGWGIAGVGLSLAIVGLLFALSQGALVRPMVNRFGERGTLVVAAVGMLLFGLASEGWTMYAVTALYCLCLAALVIAWRGSAHQAVPAPTSSHEVAAQAVAI